VSLVFDYCARGSLYNMLEALLAERELWAEHYGVAALDAWGLCSGALRAPYCPPGCTAGADGGVGAGSPGGAAAAPHVHTPLLVRLASGQLAQPPPPPTLSWRRRLRMARDGAAALAYLHALSPPIAHRDVKSQNFLVTRGYRLKLSDFGESRTVAARPPWAERLPPPAGGSGGAGSSRPGAGEPPPAAAVPFGASPLAAGAGGAAAAAPLTTGIGTVQWMAPEMLRRDPHYHGPALDVFAFGTVLWELAALAHPWEGETAEAVTLQTLRGRRLPIPDDCPSAYARLVRACWEHEPSARPTSAYVLARLQRMLDAADRQRAREHGGGRAVGGAAPMAAVG
jgi:serine/threonine protein kinase